METTRIYWGSIGNNGDFCAYALLSRIRNPNKAVAKGSHGGTVVDTKGMGLSTCFLLHCGGIPKSVPKDTTRPRNNTKKKQMS